MTCPRQTEGHVYPWYVICHIGGHQSGNLCNSHCATIVSSSYNNNVTMNFITYLTTRITQEKELHYKYSISLIFIIILFANVLGFPSNYPPLIPVIWWWVFFFKLVFSNGMTNFKMLIRLISNFISLEIFLFKCQDLSLKSMRKRVKIYRKPALHCISYRYTTKLY